MLQRRAKAADIKTNIGNHSLRATGITDDLKYEGTLDNFHSVMAPAERLHRQLILRMSLSRLQSSGARCGFRAKVNAIPG
jgi:hypothetical protein